jgi:hypothetical protein
VFTIWVCNFLAKVIWRKSCSKNVGEIDYRSTEELNSMELEGFLDKARLLYVSKISKGEVYVEPGQEALAEEVQMLLNFSWL